MRFREIGIQLQSQSNLSAGFRQIAIRITRPVNTTESKVTLPGAILDVESLAQRFLGVIKLSLLQIDFAERKLCVGSFRINFKGPFERFLGFVPLPLVHVSSAQTQFCFNKL